MKKVSLTSVCDFQGGTQPPKNEWRKIFKEGYIRMIQIRDYTQRDKNNIEYVFKKKTLKTCKKEDVLIGRYGASIGKICTGLEGAYNVALVKTIPDLERINPRYFYHLLKSDLFQNFILNIGSRAAQAGFNKGDLENLEIPLPTLSIQERIAAILDAADMLRQKDQSLLKKYDDLTQSLFLDMFGDPITNPKGWEKVKLGLVTHMRAGKFVPASEIYKDSDVDLYPCYGGNGLRGFVKSNTHNGDFVLIGRQGALCGNVKIARGVFHATEHAIVCSPIMEYETMWLYFLLGIVNLNKYATGAAQPGLNVGKLVEVEIYFPPYSLQKEYGERVKVIEKQIEQVHANSNRSEDLFQSLLQKAFKGELVDELEANLLNN